MVTWQVIAWCIGKEDSGVCVGVRRVRCGCGLGFGGCRCSWLWVDFFLMELNECCVGAFFGCRVCVRVCVCGGKCGCRWLDVGSAVVSEL